MKGKSAMASSSRRSAGSHTPSPSRQSHPSGSRKSDRKSGLATTAIFGEDDEDLSDIDDAEDAMFNSRPVRSNTARSGARSNSRNGYNAPTSSNTNSNHSPKRKPERKKEERKASVRKETYDLDGTDSELSDAPEENSTSAKDAMTRHESDDPNLTDSDDEMAEKLREAGDGESLLGSAISDREGGDTDQEEERFIIEDARRLQAKADARRQRDGSTPQRTEKSISPSAQKRRAQRDDDPFPDNASGSLSPQTLQQLGLDELFGEPDGFHSSSEPSFTDFFMSDSEEGTDDDGLELEARSDDDQLTTDDDDDESDISDMEDGLLSAPFLSEALAAGAGTQLMPHNADAIAQADIPLLVIEDLDGRLIYARAGDGEAVFGSDGEFEFVDDSEEESDEDDIHFPMDGFNGTRWTNWRNEDGDETDEGETTDELPNEDMPFPRLLVGSVAPRGGRNARRARALAARSRRISPARARGHSREVSATKDMIDNIEQNAKVNENVKEQNVAENENNAALQDVDFSISTEDLARDPKATLEAAAKSLGLSVDEVAQLVIGSAASTSNNLDVNGQAPGIPNASYLSPEMNNVPLPIPVTPEQQRYQAFRRAPLMGSFMPTSTKGVHRAVIDGSNQAPSPFSNRFGTQRKGLANGKKRQPSQSTPSAKRLRRESAASMAYNSEYGESHENSAQPEENIHEEEIDEMDLDDVMDASMMWRGSYGSSPPHGSMEEKAGSLGKKSPAMRPSSGRKASNAGASGTSSEKSTGLNMNAVARWHRIPMGAFRDGQVTASHAGSSSNVMANQQQPLGSFLLTRARGGGQHGGKNGSSLRAQAEHSPFRGRTRGDSIHLGQAPKMTTMQDAFIVSPVLWPSNSNGQARTNASLGQQQMHQFIQSQNNANDTRKMTTRREKRERKARRAALKSALESAATEGTPDPIAQSPSNQTSNAGSALLDSPSTALPKLSITDASPHGSPLASKSKPLPPSGLSKEISGGKIGEFAVPDAAASAGKNKSSGAIDIPSSSAFSSSPSMTGITQGSQAGVTNPMSGSMPTTSPSSSLSSQHQPPSSVFGMPLHSPLFGSILNPTNLGFRDDLDERDDEGVLTI